MKAKFIKIKKTEDPICWWNHRGIIGKTFEILEISKYNFAKIEYSTGLYGWIPLEMHEVNPHLKRVK